MASLKSSNPESNTHTDNHSLQSRSQSVEKIKTEEELKEEQLRIEEEKRRQIEDKLREEEEQRRLAEEIKRELEEKERQDEIQFRENIVKAQQMAKREIIDAKVQRRKKEIEVLLHLALRESSLSKKEYDMKVKLLEDQRMLIERSLDSAEDEHMLEQILGFDIKEHISAPDQIPMPPPIIANEPQKQQPITLLNKKQEQLLAIKDATQSPGGNQQNNELVIYKDPKAQQKEAGLLIKRLHLEKKERKALREAILHQEDEKKRQEIEEAQRKAYELQKKLEEDKRKQHEEAIKRIQDKEVERRKHLEDAHYRVQEVIKQKPLYQKYEERFKQQIELPQLEQKKRQLEEIRNFYKPIDKSTIEEHAMKYERVRQSKLEESKKAREASIQAEREHLMKLKENFSHKIDTEATKNPKQIEEELLAEEKRKLKERVRSYARNVKEMYWPKISEEKKVEMEHLKDPSLRHSVLKLKASLVQRNHLQGIPAILSSRGGEEDGDEEGQMRRRQQFMLKKEMEDKLMKQKQASVEQALLKKHQDIDKQRQRREQIKKQSQTPAVNNHSRERVDGVPTNHMNSNDRGEIEINAKHHDEHNNTKGDIAEVLEETPRALRLIANTLSLLLRGSQNSRRGNAVSTLISHQQINQKGNAILLTPEQQLGNVAQSSLAVQQPSDDKLHKKLRKRSKKLLQSAAHDGHHEISSRTGNSRYHQDSTQKSLDYLTVQRLKRAEQEGLMPKRITESQQIEKLLRDAHSQGLSEFERMELVRRRAEIVEQKAMRDELLIKHSSGGQPDVDQVIAINDKYIDAITAKLKILDQI